MAAYWRHRRYFIPTIHCSLEIRFAMLWTFILCQPNPLQSRLVSLIHHCTAVYSNSYDSLPRYFFLRSSYFCIRMIFLQPIFVWSHRHCYYLSGFRSLQKRPKMSCSFTTSLYFQVDAHKVWEVNACSKYEWCCVEQQSGDVDECKRHVGGKAKHRYAFPVAGRCHSGILLPETSGRVRHER